MITTVYKTYAKDGRKLLVTEQYQDKVLIAATTYPEIDQSWTLEAEGGEEVKNACIEYNKQQVATAQEEANAQAQQNFEQAMELKRQSAQNLKNATGLSDDDIFNLFGVRL